MVESEHPSTSITNKEIKQLIIGRKEVAKIEAGDLVLYKKTEEENIINNKIDTCFREERIRSTIYLYLEDINGNGLNGVTVTEIDTEYNRTTTYITDSDGLVLHNTIGAVLGKTYIFEGNEQYNPSSIEY
jgi:hypothetical protein